VRVRLVTEDRVTERETEKKRSKNEIPPDFSSPFVIFHHHVHSGFKVRIWGEGLLTDLLSLGEGQTGMHLLWLRAPLSVSVQMEVVICNNKPWEWERCVPSQPETCVTLKLKHH